MQFAAHPPWRYSTGAKGAVAALSPGFIEGTLFAPCDRTFILMSMAFNSSETYVWST